MRIAGIFYVFLLLCGCKSAKITYTPREVFRSDRLIITQISKSTFVHTTFLETNDFGKVPCNGLVVREGKQVVLFDTPANERSTQDLVDWLAEQGGMQIVVVVPTHFHADCLAGLKVLHDLGVPSYAHERTVRMAQENHLEIPQMPFKESLALPLGKSTLAVAFFGEGHTADNVVAYFAKDEVLFGGCLVKELNAGKGFLGDANVAAWSQTVEKVKQAYPNVKTVVPGHGKVGNAELLDYTIALFTKP